MYAAAVHSMVFVRAVSEVCSACPVLCMSLEILPSETAKGHVTVDE